MSLRNWSFGGKRSGRFGATLCGKLPFVQAGRQSARVKRAAECEPLGGLTAVTRLAAELIPVGRGRECDPK